jgi:hypothetical protein
VAAQEMETPAERRIGKRKPCMKSAKKYGGQAQGLIRLRRINILMCDNA